MIMQLTPCGSCGRTTLPHSMVSAYVERGDTIEISMCYATYDGTLWHPGCAYNAITKAMRSIVDEIVAISDKNTPI